MSKQGRRQRPRPTPKWLLDESALDRVAQRRCLMLLSVLSGEKPVTEAIAEAEISRQMYYQLETRALQAMLRAVTPGSDDASATSGTSRLAELEEKVTKLEREKRRAERLLLLTRKTVQGGGLKVKQGRPRTRRPKSQPSTRSGGSASTTPTTSSPTTSKEMMAGTRTPRSASPLTLTTGGGGGPSSGTES